MNKTWGFKKINFEVNETDKKIIITIPNVEILDISVIPGSMDYIFTDDDYETETIASEANALCVEDLKQRVEDDSYIREIARENAVSTVEALFKSWIETVSNNYTVEIN